MFSLAAPQVRWIKFAAYAAATVALAGGGALVEHWRMNAKVLKKEIARQSALSERQQKAMGDAMTAVLASHEQLEQTRAHNRELVAAATLAAPKAPEYACRDTALPEDYLETFRK